MLPARPLSGLQPGFVRGLYGYDIDQIFCEQHHALIYHGRRKADGLPILIKLLRDHEASDWGADWFERDYQIAQGLGAAYVAMPLAFEQTDCGPALVYADEGAQPLERLAGRGPLDIETALTVGAALAEAVSRLHKERVIHCNLNPVTVWLHKDGAGVLLSDFGSARHLSEDRGPGALSYDDLLSAHGGD
jgi:serine/threonine protein kinase